MKPQDFKIFLARINELSNEQRKYLTFAMDQIRGNFTAIIEACFGDNPLCPHCASDHIAPWGETRGLKRHRCRACKKTFTALTGVPLSGLHNRGVWLDYAATLRDQSS